VKSDIPYLDHIRGAIGRVERFTAGGHDEFFASELVQDATLRNLQTIAEAAKRLSEELRASEPGVPWRQIAGFRNVLVHEYQRVDLDLVWRVVSTWLPELKVAAARMSARGTVEPGTGEHESSEE
jgi:uncharacterized protein with HEPN domain